MSGRDKIGSSVAWTGAARGFAQLSQFLIFLVAARSLGPEGFGAFAVVSAIHFLVLRLVASGWREFIISWEGEQDARDHAFTLSTLIGLAAGGLALSLIGALSALGLFPEYRALMVWMALSLLGVGTTASASGELYRSGRASWVARGQFVGELISAGLTIGALLSGLGVEALGIGRFSYQVVEGLWLIVAAKWWPRWRLRSSGAAELHDCIKNLAGSTTIGFLQNHASTILLGTLIGPAEVGIFRAANRLVSALSEVISEMVSTVGWVFLGGPRDSEGKAERDGIGERAERLMSANLLLAGPLFIGCMAVAETLRATVFAEEWEGLAPVLLVLAFARLVGLPCLLLTPVLTLARQVAQLPRLRILSAAVSISVVIALGSFGALAVALGQVGSALFASLLAMRAYATHAEFRWQRVAQESAASLGASVMMLPAVWVMRNSGIMGGTPSWLALIIECLMGASVFLVAFAALGGKKAAVQALRLVKSEG